MFNEIIVPAMSGGIFGLLPGALLGILSHLPPAPLLFLAYFLNFSVPIYLSLLAVRTLLEEFPDWLPEGTAGTWRKNINLWCTLGLAGFPPAFMTVLFLFLTNPDRDAGPSLLAGFAVLAAYPVFYWMFFLTRRPRLTSALSRPFWHACCLGGFWFCLLLGAVTQNATLLVASLGSLALPFVATLVLPFYQPEGAPGEERDEDDDVSG